MGIDKPFHRNYRKKSGVDQSWGDSAEYILDINYAKSARHFISAYKLIQKDLIGLFEYIDPSEKCLGAFSYRTHELLMRTCIEVEANFKAILEENGYQKKSTNMCDYRKVDVSHHLSSYEVILPSWREGNRTWVPFSSWRHSRGQAQPVDGIGNKISISPGWYDAYNQSKHNRQENFDKANLENLITAVSGLLVLITSQFKDLDFTSSQMFGAGAHDYYYPEDFAIGGFFRIKYPDDWTAAEMYNFDWSNLPLGERNFEKFDYSVIPD